jgi:hypothetical protein
MALKPAKLLVVPGTVHQHSTCPFCFSDIDKDRSYRHALIPTDQVCFVISVHNLSVVSVLLLPAIHLTSIFGFVFGKIKSEWPACTECLIFDRWYYIETSRCGVGVLKSQFKSRRPSSQGDGVRLSTGVGSFFSSPPRPDRRWDQPSLLSNGTEGSFPWSKAAGSPCGDRGIRIVPP